MFLIDQLILIVSVLILLGILSSKLSARLGLPMLVLFLLLGMLAGEEGFGRLAFDNPQFAHAIGTIALAFILFDGGLQTPMSAVKRVWKPASVLATLGVLVTALITGAAASFILPITLMEGLLIGAIVGSTDAAAVFSLLRNAGINLNERLKATLEIESASNDPMAIFLTVSLLEILVNDLEPGSGFLKLFLLQMGGGAIIGLLMGYLSLKLLQRIHLQASGLYPVLVAALGLFTFGLAANLGGSGFLAIFICGVMIGNNKFAFQKTTFLFHDGLAWLSQIMMFVMLGLLINPSSLLEVWWQGLLIAGVLIFIARPIAVVPVLKFLGFNNREITLVSWVGLRGSVPIILAIFPLIYGLQGADLIFSAVFFVVLISATLQGSTLPIVAKKLNLIEPDTPQSAATLEITSLGDVDAEIVEYTLTETSKVANRRLSRIALPEGVVVAMITRQEHIIPPRGSTVLQAGDHLFIVQKNDYKSILERVFSEKGFEGPQLFNELRLKGTCRLGDLNWSYNLELPETLSELTLEDFCRQQLVEPAEQMSFVSNSVKFTVAEMIGPRIVTVTIEFTSVAPANESEALAQ